MIEKGLFTDVDNGADTLPKKIRNGEIAQYNFILGASYITRFSCASHTSPSFWNFKRAFIFCNIVDELYGAGDNRTVGRHVLIAPK